MKLSTQIARIRLKYKIIEAMEPVTHQIALPYEPGKISEAYNNFYKRLDELLNIKLEV